MKFEAPLYGICDGHLEIFGSIEEAEGYIEPIDVENNEWQLFDSSGLVVVCSVKRQSARFFWLFNSTVDVVEITLTAPPKYDRCRMISAISALNTKMKVKQKINQKPDGLDAMTLEQFKRYVANIVQKLNNEEPPSEE